MLKRIWFRFFHKRSESIPTTITEDLKWFLDLNYISEETEQEATESLYDFFDKAETSIWLPDPDDIFDSTEMMLGEDMRPIESDDSYSAIETETSELDQIPILNNRSLKSSVPDVKKEKTDDKESTKEVKLQQSLDDVLVSLGITFQQKLFRLIDAKGYTDSQVYKKANLDRKLFSKMRCNKDYKPSKTTALSLAIALELNLDEATDLLSRAGLAFSPSNLTDMIIKYCIMHKIYDIYDVNALLYEYDQQLLGN